MGCGSLRDVPELREAWEDPLFEHARKRGGHSCGRISDLAQVVGYLSVLVLAAIVAAIARWIHYRGRCRVHRRPILALFAWSARPGTPRDLLLFLDVPTHPLWAELPMTPDWGRPPDRLEGGSEFQNQGPDDDADAGRDMHRLP